MRDQKSALLASTRGPRATRLCHPKTSEELDRHPPQRIILSLGRRKIHATPSAHHPTTTASSPRPRVSTHPLYICTHKSRKKSELYKQTQNSTTTNHNHNRRRRGPSSLLMKRLRKTTITRRNGQRHNGGFNSRRNDFDDTHGLFTLNFDKRD